jgi:hypothetical protein
MKEKDELIKKRLGKPILMKKNIKTPKEIK